MILEMLRWWYAKGWLQAVHRIPAWITAVDHAFSLTILTRTLFAPWKRIVADPGRGLDAKLHASMDNLVSRCIGFVIRISVILAALGGMLVAGIAGVLIAAAWPFLPLLVLAGFVKGIVG